MEKSGADGDTAWIRMRFRGNKVWVAADGEGRPLVQGGRARFTYRRDDDREYRTRPDQLSNLSGDAGSRGTAAPSAGGEGPPPAPPDSAGATIHIYTDGASSGNPGPSGIGVVLLCGGRRKEISDFVGEATNNIAELLAIQKGLAAVRKKDRPVRVYTDSGYAYGVLCLKWKPKKNLELIAAIRQAMRGFSDLKLIQVRGHEGLAENEKADQLATSAIKRQGPG